MSAFSISFEPAIASAGSPVSDAWIAAFDWSNFGQGSDGFPELLISFYVDDQRFCYYPDAADGILGELMECLASVLSAKQGSEIVFAIQSYTVLCAELTGRGLQFYSPSSSFDGAHRLQLERLILVGEPIATSDVELVLREAIASVAQLITRQREGTTKE